jgi:ligand-binding sensor domain-containing protein/cbb3-type cytochrome oxidase subunit 3
LLFPLLLAAQQYNFHNYSVKEGIGQSQVYDMLQDSRGYLWIGTRGGGITKFDGNNFKSFSTKDGLPNNYIMCIKEDKNGHLWIGTNNGLSEYNGIKFKNYTIIKNEEIIVYDLDFDKKNNLWIASNKGLIKYDGKTFVNISKEINDKQIAINTILCSRNNSIYYANANGIFQLISKNNTYELIKYKNITQVNCIREDAKNKIWIGTYSNGLWFSTGNKFTKISNSDLINKAVVWKINFDRKNNILLSTLSNGVIEFNPINNEINNLTEKEGLANNHVRCALQDKFGNYWYGTSGGGISNYFGKMFTTYDKSNGLGGNFIYSIFTDSKNRTWIGNSNMGVSIYDSLKFTKIDESNGFVNQKIKAINEDNYGNIYLGTEGDGLYIFQNHKFDKIDKLNHQYIRYIEKDKEGNMWIASAGNGLYEIIPSTKNNGKNYIIKHFTLNDKLIGNRITALHSDKRNRVWYSTENDGISFIENEIPSNISITTKNGLPDNSIRCMKEDNYGKLWIGTANGIATIDIYKNLKTTSDFKNKLTSDNIYLITFDTKENIMIGSESGIDYLKLDEKRKLKEVKHYSKGDGFVGIETCQNSVFNNSDGTIWFGTINGLTKYNPSNLIKNESETVTNITDVKLFYNSIINTPYKKFVGDWNHVKFIELPYNKNHLTFDISGINFSNPDAVKYKWKLEGFDNDWSPASNQRSVTYSNIPSGTFTFKVVSCNEDDVWNLNPQKITIIIHKPFWKQWWFIICTIIILVGIIWWILKQREANIKKKANEAQQKLIMEKELIELEHKALRLQMNPHFIFNALNSIQSQIGTNNEQNARFYLAKFSKLMRQILDNSRNSLITLKDEIDMLENYLLIEKFCNDNKFEYSITIDENLETDFIKIPPMILQPFVENAIKHGMKYLQDKKGQIDLMLVESENEIVCTITDNGIGRKKSAELNKNSRDAFHKSTALIVTEERLNLLKNNSASNSINIIDLYDENGNATGTKVEVKIPIT